MIDTNVLEHIRFREDSKAIYAGIIDLAKAKIVRTVPQVFDELKKLKTGAMLAPHRADFMIENELRICDAVKAKMQLVKDIMPDTYGSSWAQKIRIPLILGL